MPKLKVIVVDDQVLLADGLKTVLELEPELEVVGVYHSGQEAYTGVMLLQPDLVLLDIQMPGVDGLGCLRQIQEGPPGTVLMLTTFSNDGYILEALAAGAFGFVLKDIRIEMLVNILRHAVEGYMMLPAPIAARVAEACALLRPPSVHFKGGEGEGAQAGLDLSAREREVAALLSKGLPNQVIARRLNITTGTARNYISNSYEKLGTSDRLRAIALLRQQLDLV